MIQVIVTLSINKFTRQFNVRKIKELQAQVKLIKKPTQPLFIEQVVVLV